MKIDRFSPPGGIDDLQDAGSLQGWSDRISGYFKTAVANVTAFLDANAGGTCQYYNPLTNGLAEPDTLQDITWNGFPLKFVSTAPGQPTDYQGAEPAIAPGQFRPEDEYLEWHVIRGQGGEIASIQFTCEGPDYFDQLATARPDVLLHLYQTYINPAVQRSDLFKGGKYDPLNRWNTAEGAMHLTHPANNLFAEVELGAEGTVLRQQNGQILTDSAALIGCADYGDAGRNSDPAIGAGVNALARQGFMITLADPVGLYIDAINDAGIEDPDGNPVPGCVRILRGKPGQVLRAELRVPKPQADRGLTVSDLLIAGTPIQFGGQVAELITMKLTGAACRAGSVKDAPNPCGRVGDAGAGTGPAGLMAAANASILVRRTGE